MKGEEQKWSREGYRDLKGRLWGNGKLQKVGEWKMNENSCNVVGTKYIL